MMTSTEVFEYLLKSCLNKKGGPASLSFKPTPLNVQLSSLGITPSRWKKLTGAYTDEDLDLFIEGTKKRRSYTMRNLSRFHDTCIVGLSLFDGRLTMFSSACKVVPIAPLDLQLLCEIARAVGAKSCHWYIDHFFCDPIRLIKPLLDIGMKLDDMKLPATVLADWAEVLKGKEDFEWAQNNNAARAWKWRHKTTKVHELKLISDSNNREYNQGLAKKCIVRPEDLAKAFNIDGKVVRRILRKLYGTSFVEVSE